MPQTRKTHDPFTVPDIPTPPFEINQSGVVLGVEMYSLVASDVGFCRRLTDAIAERRMDPMMAVNVIIGYVVADQALLPDVVS